MATLHSLTCPHCLHDLLAEFSDSVGGLVKNVVILVDPATLRPVVIPDSVAAVNDPVTAVPDVAATAEDNSPEVDEQGNPVNSQVTE